MLAPIRTQERLVRPNDPLHSAANTKALIKRPLGYKKFIMSQKSSNEGVPSLNALEMTLESNDHGERKHHGGQEVGVVS